MTDAWLTEFEKRRGERETADRTFTLLGEQLTVKATVAPQITIRFNNARRDAILDAQAAIAAREANTDLPDPRITDEQMIEIAEETARALLDDSSLDAWERLRSSDNPAPLSFREIFEVCDYLIARASGLPIDAPAASSNGRQTGGRSSTAGSSSKAAPRKH